MGLITGLLTLPLAPVRGVAWVAEQVRDEAARQSMGPGAVQAELAEVERLRDLGEITPEEADEREARLVDLLIAGDQAGLELGS
jgi:hypothetical protein